MSYVKTFKTELTKVASGCFPITMTKYRYYMTKHKHLNLKAPTTFDEKLCYLKLFEWPNNKSAILCSDKYLVRSYIEQIGCGELLNTLYGVWDSPEDIPFDELPDQFVLKCNHGCHMNIIVTKKATLDVQNCRRQLNLWLREKQWKEQIEPHYSFIQPRIICEKYLKPAGGVLPPDFKFYCFNGEPVIVLIVSNREESMELTFRDLQWNLLEIGTYKNNIQVEKPVRFDEMIDYCRKISTGFPFVRVDFYEIDGKIIFGEMTFTPAGGNADYYNDYGQQWLGSLLHI